MGAGNFRVFIIASIVMAGAITGCLDPRADPNGGVPETGAHTTVSPEGSVFGGGREGFAAVATVINLTNVVRIAGEFETGGWVMYRFNLSEPSTSLSYLVRERFESFADEGEDHFIYFSDPRFVREGESPFGISNFLIGNASRLTSDSNWSVFSAQSVPLSDLVAFIATDGPMRFNLTLRFAEDDVEGDLVDAIPFAHGSGTRVLATRVHDPVAPGFKLHGGTDEIAAESNETGIQFFAVNVQTAPVVRYTSRLVKIRDHEVSFSNGASSARTDTGAQSDPKSGFAVPHAPPGPFNAAFKFLDSSTRLDVIAGFIPADLEVLLPGLDLENVFNPWVIEEEDAYVDPWASQRVGRASGVDSRAPRFAD